MVSLFYLCYVNEIVMLCYRYLFYSRSAHTNHYDQHTNHRACINKLHLLVMVPCPSFRQQRIHPQPPKTHQIHRCTERLRSNNPPKHNCVKGLQLNTFTWNQFKITVRWVQCYENKGVLSLVELLTKPAVDQRKNEKYACLYNYKLLASLIA